MTSRLQLRIVVPDLQHRGGTVQVRPVIDGRDILEVFPEGPGAQPEKLLAPDGPLTAAAQPHEVCLATAKCTEECCGALYVSIRRDGDQVVWGAWRNPDDEALELPEFRFDAAEYDRELRDAGADTSWEWPARTVARLLGQRLREEPGLLARWDCELHAVVAWPWQRDDVTVLFFHPGLPAAGESWPWQQFKLNLPVGHGDPADEVARLVDQLVTTDPRQAGQRCGGG
ncbi:hypothetical protein AB0M36_35490 [Actinoplanes sp. NPDC051346]|uniref:hypothetical protein n=1 Tax=Actinoplanes sp. NPDC051346 TaxID=3155048 RepID=UPI00341F4CC7